ncbi:MAG: FAD-binding domain-containing protein [Acidimicrobiia bacterium]|nr:FAD-binding domain-containing protein [Acidimicrobiia bacterium]
MTPLPIPQLDREAVREWVAVHLDGLCSGTATGSPAFVGGQTAANRALAEYDVAGYASTRNEVWPDSRQGASRLSPYIRHNLIPLPEAWKAVAGGPARDVAKFRDELLWQEYARHLYARLGIATRTGLRASLLGVSGKDGWPREMKCVDLAVGELENDGWVVNQARMWLASHWAVREGADWREGEDRFFRHLLDGSRAANRLGWQWTAGTGNGRPYGFSRKQVERRAPGLCRSCPLQQACPIGDWPDDPNLEASVANPSLQTDPDVSRTAGPVGAETTGTPEAVWLTAESLGDRDPALEAHPDLPAVFVFDEPLLHRLQLDGKRLVFLTETLADLATRRAVEIHRGRPEDVLADRPVAATFTPVPGWRRKSRTINPVVIHPWLWLRRPASGSVASFSAWRKSLDR